MSKIIIPKIPPVKVKPGVLVKTVKTPITKSIAKSGVVVKQPVVVKAAKKFSKVNPMTNAKKQANKSFDKNVKIKTNIVKNKQQALINAMKSGDEKAIDNARIELDEAQVNLSQNKDLANQNQSMTEAEVKATKLKNQTGLYATIGALGAGMLSNTGESIRSQERISKANNEMLQSEAELDRKLMKYMKEGE